ncbi:chemotaxis protein CheW [Salinivirga cyanobacteriivorans]
MEENSAYRSILHFQLGTETLGVGVSNVLEVLRNNGLTPIPRSADFVRGIVQFRGEIITVIDFSEKLNLHENEPTSGKVIIVFQIKTNEHSFKVGVLADDVKAVEELHESDIKTVDEITHYYNPEYLEGVVKLKEEFVIVLDVNKIFSDKDIELIKTTAKNDKK